MVRLLCACAIVVAVMGSRIQAQEGNNNFTIEGVNSNSKDVTGSNTAVPSESVVAPGAPASRSPRGPSYLRRPHPGNYPQFHHYIRPPSGGSPAQGSRQMDALCQGNHRSFYICLGGTGSRDVPVGEYDPAVWPWTECLLSARRSSNGGYGHSEFLLHCDTCTAVSSGSQVLSHGPGAQHRAKSSVLRESPIHHAPGLRPPCLQHFRRARGRHGNRSFKRLLSRCGREPFGQPVPLRNQHLGKLPEQSSARILARHSAPPAKTLPSQKRDGKVRLIMASAWSRSALVEFPISN